jgi:hypothetical protein
MRALIAFVALAVFAQVGRLEAQFPTGQQRTQPQQRQPEDTIPVPPFRHDPPVSPTNAMVRSFILPGWGQATLGRRGAGGVFVFFEGLTLTMWVKSLHQQDYQERVAADDETQESKTAEVEDWLVLLVFNHLLAGLEAYVSANLWDFPTELEARVLPDGSVGFGVAIPVSLPAP